MAKKEKSKTDDKPNQIKKPGFEFISNKIFAIGLIAICFVALSLTALVVIQKLFSAKNIAHYLSKNETIFFSQAELKSLQALQLKKHFEKNPAYNPAEIIKRIENHTGLNFQTDLQPWLGSKIGYAVLTAKNNQTHSAAVFFLQTRNKEASINALRKYLKFGNEEVTLISSEFKKHIIYNSQKDKLAFSFLDKYMIIGEQPALEQLIESQSDSKNRLAKSPYYITVAEKLPRKFFSFSYLNPPLAAEYLSKIVSLKSLSLAFSKPVLNLFPAVGLAVVSSPHGLYANIYAHVDKKTVKDNYLFKYSENYQPALSAMLNTDDLLFFSGGTNLTSQIKRMFEVSKEIHPTAALIAEGLLRAKKTEYFGQEISLEEDLYPLFESEYAFSLFESLKKPKILAALKLGNPDKDQKILQKLQSKLLQLSALFEPKIQTVTLPDGTSAQEIIIPDQPAQPKQEKYLDYTIQSLNLAEYDKNIHLAIAGDIALISTDNQLLKNTLDNLNGNIENRPDLFMQSHLRSALEKLNLQSDEISIINLKNLGNPDKYVPFNALVSGSTIFDDGIVIRIFAQVEN